MTRLRNTEQLVAITLNEAMQFYINRHQQQLGPFDEAEVRAQVADGSIALNDLVWWEGQTGWVQVGQSFLARKPATGPLPVLAPAVPAAGATGTVSSERTSGFAIAALASGIASFFIGFTFIAAIILGHMGLSEIRKNPGMKGRGMALTGLILGYVVPAMVLLVAIGVFLLLGQNVKNTFHTINAQIEAAQTNAAPANGQ